MPIRFRCRHCDQLLGIARRKAGSQVRCPTCQNLVDVPYEDEPSRGDLSAVESIGEPQAPPALFERDDFEDLLQGGMVSQEVVRSQGSAVRTPPPATRAQPSAPPPPPPIPMPAARPTVGAEPAMNVAPVAGVVLSPAGATVLTVIVILLLAVAFALGLIVGRFLL